jgi:RNA polymerase sigma-70 factor (ECF subfamily)
MKDPDKTDWILGELLMDPQRLFVLWAIKIRFCTSPTDFRNRYGPGLPIIELVENLKQDGFLLPEDEELVLTEMGEQAVACLDDYEVSSNAAGQAGKEFEPEQELIALAKAGDADSFVELIRRHRKRVYGICYGFVWNKDEAKSLADEACARVWRAHGRLDLVGNFGAYLAKTARNLCIDWLKKETSKGPLAWDELGSIDDVIEGEHGGGGLVIDSITDPNAADPEQGVIDRELVERCMQKLSPIQRYVLVQRHVEGRSTAEIAQELNRTWQNANYHERTARHLFIKCYSEIISDVQGGTANEVNEY